MSDKYTPERTCIACRKKGRKEEFFRVVFDKKQGNIIFDSEGKAEGRGAYICRSLKCIETAAKKKSLGRALKRSVPDDVYRMLKEELDGSKAG